MTQNIDGKVVVITGSASFAQMVAFAMGLPEDVDVNEILFRPIAQEL
jgi:hypothetical protein